MKIVREKSHCILQQQCRSKLIQYYQHRLAILMTILEITAFVPGNDIFLGIDIKQEHDTNRR